MELTDNKGLNSYKITYFHVALSEHNIRVFYRLRRGISLCAYISMLECNCSDSGLSKETRGRKSMTLDT